MKAISLHEEADAETVRIAMLYNREEPGLGFEFLEELDRALQLPRGNPKACPEVYKGIRRLTMRRFPYSIYYVEESQRLRVLSVAHNRQKPGYWLERMKQ